jgi:small-conductance mechanosensitive channel
MQLYNDLITENHGLIIMLISLALLYLIIIIYGWCNKQKLSQRWLSGKYYGLQVLGALLKSHSSLACISLVYLAFLLLIPKIIHRISEGVFSPPANILIKVLVIAMCFTIFGITAYIIANLNKLYSLRRQETRITVSQIILLSVFGLCLAASIYTLGIEKDSTGSIIVSVFGAVLSWIFQDTIKSVVAFFYLRANHLLKIGDWIEIKEHDIDGMLKRISLTTVVIENWDTTTSCFPTYILHTECFKNNQKMMEGRTHGRQMLKTFIIDTGWIHALSEADVKRLNQDLNIDTPFKEQYVKVGLLNIEVFRHYIYHWLMQCSHVSHEPRLIVRWLEQTNEGMPLQIYAFIMDSSLAPFEWQQSQIIEHIIKAMTWFDIQLYQSPSGYDASNSNIYLSPQEADYKIKKENYVPLSR